jgi:hypothetical protein
MVMLEFILLMIDLVNCLKDVVITFSIEVLDQPNLTSVVVEGEFLCDF